jgi:hypothetical protein
MSTALMLQLINNLPTLSLRTKLSGAQQLVFIAKLKTDFRGVCKAMRRCRYNKVLQHGVGASQNDYIAYQSSRT